MFFPWNYTDWKNKWVIKYFFLQRKTVIFYTSSPWLRICDILVQKPLAGKRKNAARHLCCPQCNTPHAFSSPKLHILLSSSLSPLNKFACFSFCWAERSHLCFALFTPARDCLRCFSAAARLLMEAKPAYNSLWQVIQTHNIKIRSSHWSSQLKKPPQAIARRLLAVAAEFRRLKIYLLFRGEIPRYFVETQNNKWSNHLRFVLVSFLFSLVLFSQIYHPWMYF